MGITDIKNSHSFQMLKAIILCFIRKLTLEAQSKLHIFLEDTKKIQNWLKKTTLKLAELGSSLESQHSEPVVDLEDLLREIEVYKLEFNVKKESMLRLTELGQTLVQDGQLSSMEVESRLGDIKTGFQNAEQTLLKTEELSYKNVSFKVELIVC